VRVALVHDYLTQHGGAERVLEVLKEIFPASPVFTSIVDFDSLPFFYRTWEIHESPLGRLPGATIYHRALLMAYPALFRSFARELREFDVVLADSSAWAHHAPASANAAHVVYCHSPARFLYGDAGYLAPARLPRGVKAISPAMFAALRALDRRAAKRVDSYVANSQAVAERIQRAYGRSAHVVYPPVDVDRFAPVPGRPEPEPEPWYLVVSRLVPHKRVDLAIEACSRSGIPLKIIGGGRARSDLEAQSGPTIEFLGYQDDEAVIDHLRRCRALILPATEDFGMTAVEAQAAGRPVIAFGRGGALESVIEGETGVFFHSQTADALLAAIGTAERTSWQPERLLTNARRFGVDRFKREIADVVDETLTSKRSRRDRRRVSPTFPEINPGGGAASEEPRPSASLRQ
jgi:glycosyltransferase involved in cell wall biosynthesis